MQLWIKDGVFCKADRFKYSVRPALAKKMKGAKVDGKILYRCGEMNPVTNILSLVRS